MPPLDDRAPDDWDESPGPPSPPLDELAARAVARARLFERAVNDRGPWFVRWGDRVVEARRELDQQARRVSFVAPFDGPQPGPIVLCHRDTPVSWREIPGVCPAGAFEVAWVFSSTEPVAA